MMRLFRRKQQMTTSMSSLLRCHIPAKLLETMYTLHHPTLASSPHADQTTRMRYLIFSISFPLIREVFLVLSSWKSMPRFAQLVKWGQGNRKFLIVIPGVPLHQTVPAERNLPPRRLHMFRRQVDRHLPTWHDLDFRRSLYFYQLSVT